MTEVIMPKMGDGMEEGTLLEWLKPEGQQVKTGEIIGTIQTDKATLELEAPATGTLSGYLIQAGATVPVGQPIAAILKSGEDLPGAWGSGKMPRAAAEPEAKAEPAPEPKAESARAVVPEAAPTEPGRVKASPLARKIAEEKGIDLAALSGSGPGGRIIEKDVLSAPGALPAADGLPVPSGAPPPADRTVELNRLRQITAQRTAQSKREVPHFYVTVEVDVERLMALRETFEEEQSGKVSVNDFVIKACALALRQMPEVNAVFEDTRLKISGAVHIGMAVATEQGLTVPVIKNADQLTLRQISDRAKELAHRAKENRLSLDELSGSTFSISNMGMLDVDVFAAIVNQPNAGILAIASARKHVVVMEDDEIQIRRRMNITGSFDHRVVDGAIGAKFVNAVRGYLENPTRLLS